MCPRRKMKTENYKNYGKCAVLEHGGVKVMMTLDIGPRIIWFGTEDLNFMNEDLERNVSKGGEFFDEHYGKGTTWYLYGGHRVWKSPEDLETYTPDNVPVEAEERPSGGRFVCRAAKWLDYALDIELADDGTLTVKNTVENKGAERTLAVWGLTVARKGGTLVLPLNDPTDDLNPVYNLVRWPYNDPHDARLRVGEKFLTLRQTDRPEAIKIGTFAKKGEAYYVVGDKAMKWECTPDEGVYGDFFCNFESYTNAHILEVEWLSKQVTLKKGESHTMTETWRVLDVAKLPEIAAAVANA